MNKSPDAALLFIVYSYSLVLIHYLPFRKSPGLLSGCLTGTLTGTGSGISPGISPFKTSFIFLPMPLLTNL